MTIPKKGSRKIIVDENTFLWKVPENWADVGYIAIVQHIHGGQLLQLDLKDLAHQYMAHGLPPITPSFIEESIREVIANGWTFYISKPTTKIDCSGILYKRAARLVKQIAKDISNLDNNCCKFSVDNVQSLLDSGELQLSLEIMTDNISEEELPQSIINMMYEAFAIYHNDRYKQIVKTIKIKNDRTR